MQRLAGLDGSGTAPLATDADLDPVAYFRPPTRNLLMANPASLARETDWESGVATFPIYTGCPWAKYLFLIIDGDLASYMYIRTAHTYHS